MSNMTIGDLTTKTKTIGIRNKNIALDGFSIASLFTGMFLLAGILIAAVVLGTAWIADYLYSDTFEAQGIGPNIDYWYMVGFVWLARLLRGFDFNKKD